MESHSHTQPESFETPASPSGGVSALEMLLPPQVTPLLLLLPTGEATLGHLPTYFYIKLLAFLVLSFLGGFQLLMRIKTIYYTTWAKAFPRPHPLHVDYQTDSERAMVALLQWKLYQIAVVTLPPIGMAGLTCLVSMIVLYLFNTFGDMAFVGLSIQLTIELFLIMMLGLFTGFAFLNSLWTSLTSLFGDVVAITEPDLPNPLIIQRCGRIAFSSPYVYVLFPAYLLLLAATIGEIVWLLTEVDIHQFISFQANVPLILMMELTTLACYLGFSYFKFSVYHHGLSIYYSKLPPQLKECFSPPPPASERAQHTNPPLGFSYSHNEG